jgi:uncharacterized protein
MDIQTTALLTGAGLIGGVVNAVAGGATLITFPAMLAAGLPPLSANASNAVALIPGHFVAALTDRRQLPALDLRLATTVGVAIAGGSIGAAILLVTPERLFTALVPALVGLATLMFALGGRIQLLVSQHDRTGSRIARNAALLPTSAYGGYFGAGLGIMLLAVLTVTSREDVRPLNALKNVLATVVGLATVAVFVIEDAIRWPETLVMLAGASGGGVLGGQLIAMLPPASVRALVTAIGALMTAIYAWRYWW